jgi:hypothetical protein
MGNHEVSASLAAQGIRLLLPSRQSARRSKKCQWLFQQKKLDTPD